MHTLSNVCPCSLVVYIVSEPTPGAIQSCSTENHRVALLKIRHTSGKLPNKNEERQRHRIYHPRCLHGKRTPPPPPSQTRLLPPLPVRRHLHLGPQASLRRAQRVSTVTQSVNTFQPSPS